MRRFLLISLGLCLAGVSGCAHGPKFQEMRDVPPDRALIYFYQIKESMMSGSKFEVKWLEQKIGRLAPDTYFPYLVYPGQYVFYVETALTFSKIALQVEPGMIYYIRCRPRGFLDKDLAMELVPPALGRAEIMDCRLSR